MQIQFTIALQSHTRRIASSVRPSVGFPDMVNPKYKVCASSSSSNRDWFIESDTGVAAFTNENARHKIHPFIKTINRSVRERLTFPFARAVDSRGRGRAERRRGKVRRTFRFRFRRLFRGNKVCRDATRVQQTARLTDAFVVARLDSTRFETQVRTG